MAPRNRPEGILAVTEIHELYKGGRGQQRGSEEIRKRERERDATNSAGTVEGGDLNTRYEIEPMGRVRRMQISPITHAGYFACNNCRARPRTYKLRRVSRISEPPRKNSP